jgi:hypothetical protein
MQPWRGSLGAAQPLLCLKSALNIAHAWLGPCCTRAPPNPPSPLILMKAPYFLHPNPWVLCSSWTTVMTRVSTSSLMVHGVIGGDGGARMLGYIGACSAGGPCSLRRLWLGSCCEQLN